MWSVEIVGKLMGGGLETWNDYRFFVLEIMMVSGFGYRMYESRWTCMVGVTEN